MAITPEQVLQAHKSGAEEGPEGLMSSIMRTPPLERMGVSRDEYYNMSEEQQAGVVAETVNREERDGIQDDSLGTDPTQYDDEEWEAESPQDVEQAEWDAPETPEVESVMVSPEVKEENVVWGAMIRSARTGNRFSQALLDMHNEGAETNSRESRSAEANKYLASEMEENREVSRRAVSGEDGPVDPEDAADTVYGVEHYNQELAKRAQNDFTLFVDAVGAPDIGEEIAEEYIGDMAMYSVIRDVTDEMGTLDAFWGVARGFLPWSSIKDHLRLAGNIDAREFMRKTGENLNKLAPEDREAALRAIDRGLEGELPLAKRAQVLQALADPATGEIAERDFSAMAPLIDIADLAVTLTGIGAVGYGIAKGVKATKVVGKNVDEAAEAVAVAAGTRNEKVLNYLGMDEDALQGTLAPFNTPWTDKAALEGMSIETQQKLFDFEAMVKTQNIKIAKEESFLKEGWLTAKEEEVALRNTEEAIKKGDGVEDVNVWREGDTIQAEFTVRDKEGVATPHKESLELKLNEDTQEIYIKDPGVIKRHTTAKGVWATEDFRPIVRQAERMEQGEANVLATYRKMWQMALEPIAGKGIKGLVTTFSPKQRKKIQTLDSLLMAGDAEKKVYTVNELKSGIALGGRKITDDSVIESYYRTRNIMDSVYYSRNAVARRELELKGFNNWNMSGGEQRQIVKPLSDTGAANNSVGKANPRHFYDEETGQIGDFATLDIDDAYDQGYVLARMDKHQALADDPTEVRYVLVDPENVTDLPLEVQKYRPGYVPKLNEKVGHVVKLARRRNIDGASFGATSHDAVKAATAKRFFSGKKEADEWVEAQNAELVRRGVDPEDQRYIRTEDRQLEKESSVSRLSDSDRSPFGGGLYTGSRSETDILYGKEGTRPSRVNAFEAISRSLTSTSKYVTHNEWRLGMEERLVKTANMLMSKTDDPTARKFVSFNELASVGTDTENGRKVKAMYDATRDWLGFPSSEELLFKATSQGILDRAGIISKLPGAEKGLHSLKSKDPIGAARSAAFHGLLGTFNVAQLLVQGAGSAMAISANIFNPAQLTKVLKDQTILNLLQHTERSEKALRRAAKIGGMKYEEMEEVVRLWDKSGMAQSVLTTADHSAAAAGYGVTMGALRRTVDKGLFFYRGGELFNRRVSFLTSLGEWKKANKGAKVTDNDLKDIVDRTNSYLLNMGKAQRASWQKGTLGLATQFQQINTRVIETMIGANGNFNKKERAKMMLGQLGMFGAAGVPLANWGAMWLAETFGIESRIELEEKFGKEYIKGINEGVVGMATMLMFGGADLEIGSRTALLGGVRDTIDDFAYSEGTVAEKLFGAFNNVTNRFWSDMLGHSELISLGLAEGRVPDPVLSMASPFLSAVSSFNNAERALIMHHLGRIPDKNWQSVISKDFSLGEVAGAAAGFRLKNEVEVHKMENWLKAQASVRKKVVNQIVSMHEKFAVRRLAGIELTEEEKVKFKNELTLAMRGVGNPLEQEKVRNAVKEKLSQAGTSKHAKTWREFSQLTEGQFVNHIMTAEWFKKNPTGAIAAAIGGGNIPTRGIYYNNEEDDDNNENTEGEQ